MNLYPESLIASESGGNWNAYNNEVGAGGVPGHGGRLQFGAARLQDAANAGIIPLMSPRDFAASPPEIQTAVENWHFQDIDRQAAARGLDQYYGQTIAGVPITQNALRSMAHLGGIGGAERFLESGGEYNPSDAYGTSLLDYAQMHGGSGATGPAGGPVPQAPMPQQNALQRPPEPQVDPVQRAYEAMMRSFQNSSNIGQAFKPMRGGRR